MRPFDTKLVHPETQPKSQLGAHTVMSTQSGSAVDSVIRFEPGEYMIEKYAYDEAHKDRMVYTVHKRTAKTVTITGPTLEEHNVTRRLQVVDGEEWFTSGDQVGAHDRNGARSRLEAPAPQELEQTNDDSRPTDAELLGSGVIVL